MSAVFPEVYRYAVSSSLLNHRHRVGRPRVVGSSRLPQRGDVIDVYAQV
jgi:hypothetical protein